MALKAVLVFLLSLLLLTTIPGSLIPSAMAARNVVNKSPPLPLLLPGGQGKNMDEKGRPRPAHRRLSPETRASSRFVQGEMDDDPQPLPTPYPTGPAGPTSVPATPCSYCGPPDK